MLRLETIDLLLIFRYQRRIFGQFQKSFARHNVRLEHGLLLLLCCTSGADAAGSCVGDGGGGGGGSCSRGSGTDGFVNERGCFIFKLATTSDVLERSEIGLGSRCLHSARTCIRAASGV